MKPESLFESQPSVDVYCVDGTQSFSDEDIRHIQVVTNFLRRLGYRLELELLDGKANLNYYELVLQL